MLYTKELTVKFDETVALENVSIEVEYPSLLTIMGPNAAGKTTLLRTILGFVRPYKGQIKVLDMDPKKEADRIRSVVGYVPQQEHISFNVPLRVIDVVLMGIMAKKKFPRIVRKEELKAAYTALDLVGLRDVWNRRFKDLSGGQQQRVLIARALGARPKLLLLDEPLSNIDVESKAEIAEVLNCLKEEHSIGIIMVTHDINPVIEYTDKAVLLNKRVIAFGDPKDVFTDENLREVYGMRPKAVVIEGKYYIITGDIHVRR